MTEIDTLNAVALWAFGPGILLAGGAVVALMIFVYLVSFIRDRIDG